MAVMEQIINWVYDMTKKALKITGDVTLSGRNLMEGDTAHDAADTGNPLKIGGKAETTAPAVVADGDRVDAWFDQYGRLVVAIKDSGGNAATVSNLNGDGATANQIGLTTFAALMGFNGTTWDRLRVDAQKNLLVGLRSSSGAEPFMLSPGDGDSTGRTGVVVVPRSQRFNGVGFDLDRNNTEGTLLASAARTATTTAPVQTNHNARCVTLLLNVTANPGGAETLTIALYYRDPVGGSTTQRVAELTIPAATNGTFALVVGLGASGASATPTQVKGVALPVPRQWSAAVIPSASGSWTYSLGYAYTV